MKCIKATLGAIRRHSLTALLPMWLLFMMPLNIESPEWWKFCNSAKCFCNVFFFFFWNRKTLLKYEYDSQFWNWCYFLLNLWFLLCIHADLCGKIYVELSPWNFEFQLAQDKIIEVLHIMIGKLAIPNMSYWVQILGKEFL